MTPDWNAMATAGHAVKAKRKSLPEEINDTMTLYEDGIARTKLSLQQIRENIASMEQTIAEIKK